MWSNIPRTFSSGFRLLQYFLFSHYVIYYLLGFLAHADWVYVHSEYPGPKHCSYLSILWIFIDMRRSKYWMLYSVHCTSVQCVYPDLSGIRPGHDPHSLHQLLVLLQHLLHRQTTWLLVQTSFLYTRVEWNNQLPVHQGRMKQSSVLYTRVEWNKQTYCTSG